MNNYQSCFLKMLVGVPQTVRPYSSIVSSLPHFPETMDELETVIDEILLLTTDQISDATGVTALKKEHKENLILFTHEDVIKLIAFAKINNDSKLLADVKISKTELRNLSDMALISCADLVHKRAEEKLSLLESYGITTATQSQQKDRRNTFLGMVNAPRTEKVKQSQITSHISDLFDKAEQILKKLDALIDIIHLTQSEFYEVYQKARKIQLTGKSSITLRGTVLQAASGEAIIGATVTITAIDATPALEGGQLTKVSAEKGGFNVKSLPDGMYRIQASKPGFKDGFIETAVSSSELVVVELKLEKR